MTIPVAFLCHASEDKPTVRVLARELMRNGVDVFFDEWEIGPGDSIRQRLDHGLGQCTHFVAVLTPISLTKPWVHLELDAGLVRKVEGHARFIPLRMGLPVSALPPLLRGMHSPVIGDPAEGAASLASFMHGVTGKPALGNPPQAVRRASRDIGISPAAQAIARLMVEHSKQGRRMDPQFTAQQLMQMCELTEHDMIDGVDELEGLGAVNKLEALGHKYFYVVSPDYPFFSMFDPIFGEHDPEEDAHLIAADLVNNNSDGASAHDLSHKLGWAPRRLNPALEYLAMRDLVMSVQALDPQFSRPFLRVTPATRRFAREAN